MFFDEIYSKKKDIKYFGNTKTKHPLLQIILKEKNKRKNQALHNSMIPISPKTSEYKAFNSLIIKNKDKDLNDTNKSNKKKNESNKIESIDNIYSDIGESKSISFSKRNSKNINKENNKIIDFSSDNSHISKRHKKGYEKQEFGYRNSISVSQPNNIFFPKLIKINSPEPKKIEAYRTRIKKAHFLDKNNKQNNLINNKTNFNNNSIFNYEPNILKKTFFQKFSQDKIKFQKSIQLSLIKKKLNNNYSKDKIPNFNISI